MKRFVSMLLVGISVLSLAACTAGGKTQEAVGGVGELPVRGMAAYQPSKDFNIRVPFAAGGSADTIARIIGQGLQKHYGKSAVINNITGAGGAIAAADLDAARPDATEMMVGGIALFTLAPLFNQDIQVEMDNYQFVSGLVLEDQLLFVNPSQTGIESWEELVAYAKENRLVFASNPPGGATHLLGTMLFGEAKLEAEAVTSDGSAKDLLALAGGNAVCAFATSSLGAQYVEEGSLKPIAVFSEEPYKGYAGMEVPTVRSLGYDIVFRTCNFLMTRKEVKSDDVEAIHQAIVSYGQTEEFKALAKNANYVPAFVTGDEVKQIISDTAEMCQKAYESYYAK